ncbi:MAG: DUF433 domain-containing protein [Euzebyaceae bacterium]|nr:DUF433 domain-containing protein [Euzebyaceae bacterium]
MSLQKLRKAVQQMDLPKHHPSEYRILGYGNDVVVVGPGAEYVDTKANLVFETVVEELFKEFRYGHRLVRNFVRPYPEVRVNPDIRHGYPCIRGTRVPFDLVAGLVEDGVSRRTSPSSTRRSQQRPRSTRRGFPSTSSRPGTDGRPSRKP